MVNVLAQSVPVVHPTGINWVGILPIIVAIIVGGVGIAGYVDGRQSRRQSITETQIKDAVNNLSNVLLERLETKENVARLSERMARVEVKIDQTFEQGVLDGDSSKRAGHMEFPYRPGVQ